jgi:hypothetical protein
MGKETTMQVVIVYRVDCETMIKDPIGIVFEKRKSERGNNNYDLLRMARKRYALNKGDASRIYIDVNRIRRAFLPDPGIIYSAE